MPRYRRKSIEVDATKWGGHYADHPAIREIPNAKGYCKACNLPMFDHGEIDTLQGEKIVCPGDYIVDTLKGEFYPVRPAIFEATYERVTKSNS